jgi:rhodanese-related sulfurtransferase
VLKEGLPAWEEKGFAVYFGPGYEKIAQGTMLSPKQFKELATTKPGSFILVDVREPEEFAAGHIPGAINIPVTSFFASAQLDQNKKIILYCSIGARSYTAYRKLKKRLFPDLAQLRFDQWKEAGYPIEK